MLLLAKIYFYIFLNRQAICYGQHWSANIIFLNYDLLTIVSKLHQFCPVLVYIHPIYVFNWLCLNTHLTYRYTPYLIRITRWQLSHKKASYSFCIKLIINTVTLKVQIELMCSRELNSENSKFYYFLLQLWNRVILHI